MIKANASIYTNMILQLTCLVFLFTGQVLDSQAKPGAKPGAKYNVPPHCYNHQKVVLENPQQYDPSCYPVALCLPHMFCHDRQASFQYRGSNDFILLINEDAWFLQNLFPALNKLMRTPLRVVTPHNTKVITAVDAFDWSQLLSIEIQTKKTIDKRNNGMSDAKLHVKFYFEASYVMHLLNRTGSNMVKPNKIAANFNELGVYYSKRGDQAVGEIPEVFSPTHKFSQKKIVVVPDIFDFISKHALSHHTLPLHKNIYVFSEKYHERLKGAHWR